MVSQADAVTDRSAAQRETRARDGRLIKFRREEREIAMGFHAFSISPANFSRAHTRRRS